MKTLPFSILTVLFLSSLFLSNGFAQISYSTLEGHRGTVYGVAFSPDGTTLASGSGDSTIRLWDAVTGEHKITLEGHRGTVYGVAFSPDGTTLASGSGDSTIRLWDAVTGEHKITLEGHGDSVSSVAFSPDGSTLASGSGDSTIRLWDAVTGEYKMTLEGTEHVSSVGFSPDGSTLASGEREDYSYYSTYRNPTIRLWDVVTGEHKMTLEGYRDSVYSVGFSPDGSTLASGEGDYSYYSTYRSPTIRLWDAVTGERKITLERHGDSVYSVGFSPDGSTLASGSEDGTVRLWKLPSIRVNIIPNLVESPAIGEQFSINLSIVSGENVGGYQVTIEFNETVLRYVGSNNGSYLPEGAFFVPPVVSENKVILGATSLAGVSNGEGTLATVTFEVVDVTRSYLILSEALLTDDDGEYLSLFSNDAEIIEPAMVTSSAVISLTPSSVLSPAVGQQLRFNVDIADGQNVADYRLTWEFDSTTLEYISDSQEDYLEGGVGNGDGTLMTRTFAIRSAKTSTVSVSGYLIRSNGFRYIPTFESAAVIAPLLGDVNRDGVVNISDLVLVGSSFTQRVPEEGNPADVNESGVVNIVDLVLVAGALNNAAAAPSAHSQKLAMLTPSQVQGWLTQAQGLVLTDATSQRGILFLEQLLAALTPKETILLPNYPNPFNPETWIPYHLAHAADVRLTIYDTKGIVVRQLDLGYQPAGYYTDRAKSAYWDGRNENGESVASGVYFYQLRAGNYSAVRRMVILK